MGPRSMALRHNLLSPNKRGSRAVREAAVAQLEVAEVAALTEEAAAPMVELVVVMKGAVHVAARMEEEAVPAVVGAVVRAE